MPEMSRQAAAASVPESSGNGGDFLNFKKEGERKVRIVSGLRTGYQYRKEKKPVRLSMEEYNKIEDKDDFLFRYADVEEAYSNKEVKGKKVKNFQYFRVVVVWSYDEGKPMALQLDKASLYGKLKDDIEAGMGKEDPTKYDIKIKKSGKGIKTEYTLVTGNTSELDKDIVKQIKPLLPLIDLDLHFVGKNILKEARDKMEDKEIKKIDKASKEDSDLPF